MRFRTIIFSTALVLGIAAMSVSAFALSTPTADALQQFDEEVPPGNPVLGDDRPGDIQQGSSVSTVLWGVVGLCLLGAGVLLVKVERWEARRVTGTQTASTS